MKLSDWKFNEAKRSRGDRYQTICECIDLVRSIPVIPDSCDTCLRQGCQYRNEKYRVNCPLYKSSAV